MIPVTHLPPPPPKGIGRTSLIFSKLNNFTSFDYRFIVLWQANSLKNKSTHKSHVGYKGDCSCGKTIRNVQMLNIQTMNLNLPVSNAKTFSILLAGIYSERPNLSNKRRILEGLTMKQWQSSLNKQIYFYIGILFPSAII